MMKKGSGVKYLMPNEALRKMSSANWQGTGLKASVSRRRAFLQLNRMLGQSLP